MAASVRVIGLDKLRGKFAAMPAKLQNELLKATEKSAAVVHKRAATYPRQRPSTSYVRRGFSKGGLAGGWFFKVYNNKRTGPWAKVYNRRPHGKWVMGQDDQASIHRGRWARTDQIADELSQKVSSIYQHHVEQGTK